MESPFKQEAIPMVAVNEHTGKYVLTKQAIKFFTAINGPIAVVSVAGLYRTGKSYLLNRVLLNRSNGFGVGPTVNPCTKGLWCWGTPIKGTSSDGQQVNIIVIDTEGIGALDEDQTHDTKIFTLAILASSCFIYNSVGSIDQTAVQNLSLVVNLTKHIQLKSSGQDEDGDDPDEISSYFPTFYWVVRDFSLQLQDAQGNPINSKEYLERALAPQNGFSDDVEEKNRIRRLLTAFFKDRDCFTMIRPLVDETKLQNLDKMDYDELRPEFVQQAMSFRKRIISSVKVKSLQNQKLNGEMYCSMINSYVTSINEGAVPNIENAWNYMCEEQCRKSLDDCYELFVKEIKEGFRDWPRPEEDFNKIVSEAEEKSLELFREKALGDRSVQVLKELKFRIREKINDLRDQNIKESNEELRKYILKNVNPLKIKLNSQQYKSFPEFEKEVAVVFEKIMKDGPKLHHYKLVYTEALRKFSSQGAEFLFKNFQKKTEKNNEMQKLKEKQLQTQLDILKEQKEALRKVHMQSTTDNDNRISDLSYKVETLTTQLDMISKAKKDQQSRMERQFTHKNSEFQNYRKNFEAKIRDLMQKLEQNEKTFTADKKQWQKEKAIIQLKSKQQSVLIEELTKKEKSLDANFNVSKNEMVNQVKELTLRHEQSLTQLRYKLKDTEDKLNEVQTELNSTNQKLQYSIEEKNKNQKKHREQMSNRRQQIDKLKKDIDNEKRQMNAQFQTLKNNSSRELTAMEEKLKENEKKYKELNETYKNEKYKLQSDRDLINQRYSLMQNEYQLLKHNHTNMKDQYQDNIKSLQSVYAEKNEESFNARITEMKAQNETEITSMKSDFDLEKKRMALEFNNLIRKCEEAEMQMQTQKLESSKKLIQQENYIEQLTNQIKYLQNNQKSIEGEKENEIWQIEKKYKDQIKQLQNQVDEIKDRCHNDKAEQSRLSEESISQIKNSYEMEKENLERRIRNSKDTYERKINDLISDYEKRLQEETENLENEIQQLNQRAANAEQMLRNTSIQMQHQIDMNKKKVDSLEKMSNELKETLERKELQFNNKYDTLYMQSKSEKDKLENRIQTLVNQNNKKDKDLMSVTHQRDQYQNGLLKKEAKVVELQNQLSTQKQNLSSQIDKLHSRISELEKIHYNNITQLVKENALLKQENEFNQNKIKDLEKKLETSNQTYEQKMVRFKEQREIEIKTTLQKLHAEKNLIDTKYKELKDKFKDLESTTRKAIIDLAKDKENNEHKINMLEEKYQQTEGQRQEETAKLTKQLTKIKDEYSQLKLTYESQIRNYQDQIQNLQSTYRHKIQELDKDKSLNLQKIQFLQNQKIEHKRDADQRISKLENELNQVNNKRTTQKSGVETFYNQHLRNTQAKHMKKINELSEEILRKTSEFQFTVKDRDQKIKDLIEKYQTQKLQKETNIIKMDKRLNEFTDNERRMKEEIDKLKADRERRENEYQKQLKEEKENYKNKQAQLQNKVKETEAERLKAYFNAEKQKSRWNYEKDNLSELITNLQDQTKKFEKDKEKYRVQVEKLKAERKNTKAHSYIGSMKTTYEGVKPTEQLNKENKNFQ